VRRPLRAGEEAATGRDGRRQLDAANTLPVDQVKPAHIIMTNERNLQATSEASATYTETAALSPKITPDNVADIFTYHSPDGDQRFALDRVRETALRIATLLLDAPPMRWDDHEASRLPTLTALEVVEELRRRIIVHVPACNDRDRALGLLWDITTNVIYGRPTDETLGYLRLCRMWANAAISLRGAV
jgi:hypothetical protein